MRFRLSDCRLASCAGKGALAALALALLPAIAATAQDVAAYAIVDAREVPESLTGRAGDPEAGRKLYFNRRLTRCSGCHGSPGGPGAQADAGAADAPSLAGVARRLTEGAIRLWLVAPQVIAPGTRMPGYYSVGQRDDPADPRYGEPLLTAGDVENLVAYLMQQSDRR